MIRALKKGEVIWYAPDHDYGPTASVFVPLFAVDQAATTSGTWMLAKMSKAALFRSFRGVNPTVKVMS